MNTRQPACTYSLAVLLFACALPAHAHHAMGNATPGTLFEGFVSGLAHPVIGIDHLLFVIVAGAACYWFGRRAATIAAFVGGTAAGTLIHVYQATLPYADAWVALTLLVLGILVAMRANLLKSSAAVVLFALSGAIHGYAYGESIVGAEPTPLAAYLAGFTLVQLAIAGGAYAAVRYIDRGSHSAALTRTAGGVLSLAGVAFLALAVWQ